MVSALLLALALVAAGTGGGARVEASAKATIQRAVTLHNGTTAARPSEVTPIARQSRTCTAADQPMGPCQLIVYDLP